MSTTTAPYIMLLRRSSPRGAAACVAVRACDADPRARVVCDTHERLVPIGRPITVHGAQLQVYDTPLPNDAILDAWDSGLPPPLDAVLPLGGALGFELLSPSPAPRTPAELVAAWDALVEACARLALCSPAATPGLATSAALLRGHAKPSARKTARARSRAAADPHAPASTRAAGKSGAARSGGTSTSRPASTLRATKSGRTKVAHTTRRTTADTPGAQSAPSATARRIQVVCDTEEVGMDVDVDVDVDVDADAGDDARGDTEVETVADVSGEEQDEVDDGTTVDAASTAQTDDTDGATSVDGDDNGDDDGEDDGEDDGDDDDDEEQDGDEEEAEVDTDATSCAFTEGDTDGDCGASICSDAASTTLVRKSAYKRARRAL